MTRPEAPRFSAPRTAHLLRDVPLRVLLVCGFLIAGLIPLMLLSLASYQASREELKQKALMQLESVRDIKHDQIWRYFQERFADLNVFAASPTWQRLGRDLVTARRRPPGMETGERQGLRHYLRTLLDQYGYDGLFLVDGREGLIRLACERESDIRSVLGRPLPSGVWREAMNRNRTVLTDVVRSPQGRFVQYLAVPLTGSSTTPAVIVARLSKEPIDRIMKERSGMGRTGETYLVGADRRLRTDSHLAPLTHSVSASLDGTIVRNGADTEGVHRALRGETGTATILDYRNLPVLSAFAPLRIGGLRWVILAEIDVAEIDRQIGRALDGKVLLITAGSALLVLVLALIITHFIGRDIRRVGNQLESLIDDVLHDRTDRQIDLQQVGADFRTVTGQANQLVSAFREHVARIHTLEEHQRFTQKLEAIGTLASGMAHDFNNILTYMLAYARLALADLPTGSPATEHLQEIVSGIQRAGALIRRMMPRRQEPATGPQHVDAREICQETITILRATLPKKIRIRGDLGEGPAWVPCAPAAWQQVLMNLCTNSYHAMRETGGELTISLARDPLPARPDFPHCLRLTVSDNGCGMSEEVRRRLFEPLFTTKPAGIGSGLGLVMVRDTVNSCGGRMTVWSEPGAGTRIDIDLPRLEGEPPAAGRSLAPEPLAGNRVRILFVDDDEPVRRAETRLLAELGFPVDSASDAQEALELFLRDPDRYQAVITDLNLPGTNGTELAAQIHRLRPDLPIFLTTGFDERLQGIDLERNGIRALLAKPLGMDELYTALQPIMEG